VTVNFTFKPACAASQITSTQTYSDYIVSKEGELEFDVNAASYSHTYMADWFAKGYAADGCTIDWRIEGEAAEWTSVTNGKVKLAPTGDVYYGAHTVNIVAYFSASSYDTYPVLNGGTLTKSLEVVV